IQPSGGGLGGTAKTTQAMPTSAPADESIPHRSARSQRGKIVRLEERSITIALPARPQTSTRRAVATLPAEQAFTIDDTTEIFVDRFVRERTEGDSGMVRSVQTTKSARGALQLGQQVTIVLTSAD